MPVLDDDRDCRRRAEADGGRGRVRRVDAGGARDAQASRAGAASELSGEFRERRCCARVHGRRRYKEHQRRSRHGRTRPAEEAVRRDGMRRGRLQQRARRVPMPALVVRRQLRTLRPGAMRRRPGVAARARGRPVQVAVRGGVRPDRGEVPMRPGNARRGRGSRRGPHDRLGCPKIGTPNLDDAATQERHRVRRAVRTGGYPYEQIPRPAHAAVLLRGHLKRQGVAQEPGVGSMEGRAGDIVLAITKKPNRD